MIKKGSMILLTGFALSSCIGPTGYLVDRIMDLKERYDGKKHTHASRFRQSALSGEEEWCAVLYRDKRLDTENDDWIPFYKVLALRIGEEELNRRRKFSETENEIELFTFGEHVDNCHYTDINRDQVAVPEEVKSTLDKMVKRHDDSGVKYLNSLSISHVPPGLFRKYLSMDAKSKSKLYKESQQQK